MIETYPYLNWLLIYQDLQNQPNAYSLLDMYPLLLALLQDHLHSVTENGHSHGYTEYHYFEGVDGWYGPASAFNYQTGQSSQKYLILVQCKKI